MNLILSCVSSANIEDDEFFEIYWLNDSFSKSLPVTLTSDITDVISPDNNKTPNTGLTTNDVLGECDHNKDGVFGPGCFHYPDFLGLYSRVSQPYFKNTKKKKKHLSYSNDVKEN